MSSENIELTRRAFEQYNAGDLDAFIDGFADDAELWPAPSWPEGGPYRGRDEIRRFYEWLREGLATGATVTARELEAAGDKVFVEFDLRAIGEVSGIEASSHWYSVARFREGLTVRSEFFTDRDAARAAAGLEPG